MRCEELASATASYTLRCRACKSAMVSRRDMSTARLSPALKENEVRLESCCEYDALLDDGRAPAIPPLGASSDPLRL